MQLSPDQQLARERIRQSLALGRRELVLTGPAGSGKTTLLRTLLSDLEANGQRVVLMAPTGKAAARLRELVGRPATTIHSLLYRNVFETTEGELRFSGARAVAEKGTVVIADEASMIGRKLYMDMLAKLPAGVQLLCVGDAAQLPPVADEWGPRLLEPTAALTKVHRQAADSPVLQAATMARTTGSLVAMTPTTTAMGSYDHWPRVSLEGVAAWYAEQPRDSALLCYSNATRRALNALVRTRRGVDCAPISPGDTLICTRTSKKAGLLNGETRTVATVAPDPDGAPTAVGWADGGGALVLPDWLSSAPDHQQWLAASKHWGEDLVLMEYGECLTVHKSQASQWGTVGLVQDSALRALSKQDRTAYTQLLYTACTRAQKHLVVFEVS